MLYIFSVEQKKIETKLKYFSVHKIIFNSPDGSEEGPNPISFKVNINNIVYILFTSIKFHFNTLILSLVHHV